MYKTEQLASTQIRQEASALFLAKVFNWMAAGLALTGVIAYLTAHSSVAGIIIGSPLFFVLIFAELGLVFYLSARVEKIQASTAIALFVGYSALNGLTLSVVFLQYTASSIASTFFIAAGMFGAMAVYGIVTKRDLSGLGSFLFMGLVGIIICSLVNFFLKSPAMSWIISGVGVIVFTGLTAYDVQDIKRIGEGGIMEGSEDVVKKGAVMGALRLYLDFINLFLMLLRFFGGARD